MEKEDAICRCETAGIEVGEEDETVAFTVKLALPIKEADEKQFDYHRVPASKNFLAKVRFFF